MAGRRIQHSRRPFSELDAVGGTLSRAFDRASVGIELLPQIGLTNTIRGTGRFVQ